MAQQQRIEPERLTAREAATIAGLSVHTFARKVSEGVYPRCVKGTKRYSRRALLEALAIEEGRNDPASKDEEDLLGRAAEWGHL